MSSDKTPPTAPVDAVVIDLGRAPCGCSLREQEIQRIVHGTLHPTIWIHCKCLIHKKTWTERYEYDFRLPLDGRANEDQ